MKLILLDRDGVINHDSDEYIKTPDEWQPITGSLEAISRLTHANYQIIVVSNQAGIGRGIINVEALNNIHMKMHTELACYGGYIDAIFYCPHAPQDNCYCRKPNPGLFDQISYRIGDSLEGIPFIGDKLSDIEVAEKVGAKPFLVKTGYGKSTMKSDALPGHVMIFRNLSETVDHLLNL